jgi:tetratricopeptide (TPR) repeat protein
MYSGNHLPKQLASNTERSLRHPAFPARPAVLALCACLLLLGPAIQHGWAEEEQISAQEMEILFREAEEHRRKMRQEMEKLDPETRRRIEAMLAREAAQADEDALPQRNEKLLARISAKPLSGAALRGHVEQLQPRIAAALSANARQRVARIETELKKRGDYLPNLRAVANGLAVWGAWPEATALMGKVALTSGDVHDLNNLASFLTMLGAEAAALPILYTLDARYPNNSTLLNNLGQARFGLGDIAGAERFLLAAARITPRHPQANATLSTILRSQGDAQGARDALLKAIEGGYSETKEQALGQLGHELKRGELRWRVPMAQDPLGLEKFQTPPYPRDAGELAAAVPAWETFREDVAAMQSSLRRELEAAKANLAAVNSRAPKQAHLPVDAGRGPLWAMASRMSQFDTEVLRRREDESSKARAAAARLYDPNKLRQRLAEIDRVAEPKYRNKPGGYQRDYTCPEALSAINDFLSANHALEEAQRDYLDVRRKAINDRAYVAQFTSPTPEHFAFTKTQSKIEFLNALYSQQVALFDPVHGGRPVCFEVKETKSRPVGKLPDFDDINCRYISSFVMPAVGRIDIRCNKMSSAFDPAFAPFKASWEEDLNTGRLLRASVEVTVEGVTVGGQGSFDEKGLKSGWGSVGVEAGGVNITTHGEFDDKGFKRGGVSVGTEFDIGSRRKAGPLEIGASGSISGNLEIDRNGISDIGLSGGTSVKAAGTMGKTDAAEAKAEMSTGVNSTWSWNSGHSGSATGGFDTSVF